MQHDARTDDRPFFRKAADLFLFHVLRKRTTSVGNSDAEEIKQLNEFITTLVPIFFDPLADLLQTSTITADTEREEIKLDALKRLKETLSKGIVTYLNIQSPPQDAPTALLEYFHKRFRRSALFSDFLVTLRAVFPKSADEVRQSERLSPRQPSPSFKYLSPEQRVVIAAIARALQDTVISIPKRYFDVDKVVPEDAKKVLKAILTAVEVIRCILRSPESSVLELSVALRDLSLQIALVEGFIWLPFTSPITAALSTKEDLSFYIRGEDDAKRLSYQILLGEGVFLITGYRGVGKSTFINQALAMCSALEEQQRGSHPWHIVPVIVSLAKASGATSVLRLSIRKLYNSFINDDATKKLLTKEEHQHLLFAYLRSIYNVNLQQIDSIETVKHLESQLSLNIKLASLFSPIGSGLADSLPSVGGAIKASRDRSNKSERTISLPDYDEDKAEEDIVDLIKMLSQLRPSTRNVRIKLVFVFDEIDKMKREEQDLILNQLKNLFLERHTVFLFVTSKEFYYRLAEARKVEDAILTSYFSWIKMVPLFTSEETTSLLKRLVPLDESRLKPESEEIKFLRTFARYLTYRSRGIPREIIRELQGMLQWGQDDLQSYLTTRQEQYHAVLVYEQLQRALESILDSMSPTVPSQSSEVLVLPSLNTSGTTASTAEAMLVPEPIWMNEERREQVKWGLYVIVEALLDRVSLEMNPEADECKKIYEDNFTMLSRQDFKSLLDRLVLRLPTIQLPIAPGSALARYYSGTDIAFFAELPRAEGGARKLTVLPTFYALTGRQTASTKETATRLRDADLTFDQIEELLQKDESVLQQRALSALQQKSGPFSATINLQLCCLFIRGQVLNLRMHAASLLQDEVACRALYEVDEDALERFLESETDGKLLQECIRLIDTSIDPDDGNRDAGIQLLLRMLDRQKQSVAGHERNKEQLKQQTFTSRLPEPVLIGAVSTLAKIADDRNALAQVVERLEPNQGIPDALLPPLKSLEAKSDRSLIELLVCSNFTGISEGTLQTFLKEQSGSELMGIWDSVIEKKQQELAQKVLVAIVLLTLGTSIVESASNQAVMWLNSSSWDEGDQHVLNEIIARDPSLRFTLVKVLDQDKQERIGVTLPYTSTPSQVSVVSRKRMIQRVRTLWIEGVLGHSLYLKARVRLDLQVQLDAVTNPQLQILREVDLPARSLSSGTSITEVYDHADGGLLILGEPGSGKTTLLLELAADLLRRADQDDGHPIPVVFNLSSWAAKKQPLADWLVEELSSKYQVPRTLGQSWVATDQLLPLLDGLDEVAKEQQGACIDAVNNYRHVHALVPMVVCSRQAEYMAETVRLQLGIAVVIQPLTQQQVEAYLSKAGTQMAPVLTALRDDPALQELAISPLMLSVLAQTYPGKSVKDLQRAGAPTAGQQVFADYVERMLSRRGENRRYSQEQTVSWLASLAAHMRRHSQTVFYLEHIQPDWLPEDGSRQVYSVTTMLIILLLVVLSFGLFGWLSFGSLGALGLGFLGALSFGFLGMQDSTIQPVERLTWSWMIFRRERRDLLIRLGLWMFVGCGIGLLFGLGFGLLFGLSFGLLGMLNIRLLGARSNVMLEDQYRITPNQGIRRSARNGLSFGLLFGLSFGLLGVLSFGLLFGLSFGLLFGLLGGLLFGGRACIQHAVLRYLLWRSGVIPLNYVRFLDYATERILLRQVGGGYIFIHRLLLDYFASLKTNPTRNEIAAQDLNSSSTS